jgi:hypothetical protein
VQIASIPCHSQELLPFLAVVYPFLPPFSTHYSSIPLILSCYIHVFLGLPLNLVFYKFTYNTFWELYFYPFSGHTKTNVVFILNNYINFIYEILKFPFFLLYAGPKILSTQPGNARLKMENFHFTFLLLNPFQSNFSATLILPSSYLFWAEKRLADYL